MVVVPLYCAAELVDLGAADGIVAPALGLESGPDCHDPLTKQAVSIDAAIGTSICNLQLLISERS